MIDIPLQVVYNIEESKSHTPNPRPECLYTKQSNTRSFRACKVHNCYVTR